MKEYIFVDIAKAMTLGLSYEEAKRKAAEGGVYRKDGVDYVFKRSSAQKKKQ